MLSSRRACHDIVTRDLLVALDALVTLIDAGHASRVMPVTRDAGHTASEDGEEHNAADMERRGGCWISPERALNKRTSGNLSEGPCT